MSGNALLDLLLLAVPALLGLLWWDGARARELAVAHARRACRERGLQFLDQSVALERWRARRAGGDRAGTAFATALERDYAFEFADGSGRRDRGTVTMVGPRLLRVRFPWILDESGQRVWLQ